MPTTNITTTSVDVEFDPPGSEFHSVKLSFTDKRDSVSAYLNVLNPASSVAVQCIIDSAIKTNTATMKTLTLHSGNNQIGPSQYNFEDGKAYSLKFVSVEKNESGGIVSSHGKCSYGSQTNDQNMPSYKFKYQPTDKEKFVNPSITNASQLSLESTINLILPMSLFDKNPHTMVLNFDQEDAGGQADDNNEPTKYTSVQNYSESNEYSVNASVLGYGSFAVSVTALFDDGNVVSDSLPMVVQILPQFAIDSVSPYGLNNGSDGGDPTVMNILDFIVNSEDLVIPQLIDSNKNINIEFRQGDTLFYTAAIDASASELDGDQLKYSVLRDDLTQVFTETDTPPVQRPDGKTAYNVTFKIFYKSNITGVTSLERSDTKNDLLFTNDYAPIASVKIINAWNAAAVTTVDGKKVIDLNNSSSKSGYDAAPAAAIMGYFDKTPHFSSNITEGFQKDLDLVDTKFKLLIYVKSQSGALTTLTAKNVRWYSKQSAFDLQTDTLSLLNSQIENKEDGNYDNRPGVRLYFLVEREVGGTMLYNTGDEVAVGVQIIAPGGVTVPSTQSNLHDVVEKPIKYEMTVSSANEPTFTAGVLTIPTSYEYDRGLKYIRVTNNLYPPNSDKTISSNGGTIDINITPIANERGKNFMTYRVYYTVEDNGVNVQGPASSPYTISLYNPPTTDNFMVTNDSYTTINDEGKSEVTFTVSFVDTTSNADGAKVYFTPEGQNQKLLIGRINRQDGDSQTKTITLNNGSDSTKTADGILLDGVGETDNVRYTSNVEWSNDTGYNIGEVSVIPYYYKRVSATNDDFDEEIINDTIEKTFTINNISKLSGNLGYNLVGGVRQSFSPTKVTWTVSDEPDITSYKATVTKHEYSTQFSKVHKLLSPDPNYPHASVPPLQLSGTKGWYYNRATATQKHTWYVGSPYPNMLEVPTGLKMKDIKNIQLDIHVVSQSPLQRDGDMAFVGFYTKTKSDGNDVASWYRSRVTYDTESNNRDYQGKISFRANVNTSSTSSKIHTIDGYEMINYSLSLSSKLSAGNTATVKDIGDEEVSHIHVSSSSSPQTSEYFVQQLTMELQSDHIIVYQFSRTGEVDDMTSITTLPGSATELVLDIVSLPKAETISVEIEKITTQPNGDAFSAPITKFEFDPPSVDQSAVQVDVKRGSNGAVVKASFNEPQVEEPSSTYQAAGVTLFSAANYTNLPGYKPLVLDVGDYGDEYLATKGYNDNLESLLIPHGYDVIVYKDNFFGEYSTYSSDTSAVMFSTSSLRVTRLVAKKPSSLVVTEVKLADNSNPANENPADAGVTALTCTNDTDDIQSYGVTNTYSGGPVAKGNVLNLIPRFQAAVKYTETQEGSDPEEKTSTATFLKLAGTEKTYRCADKIQVIVKNHRTQVGGSYNGRLALDFCVNSGGMGNEGVQSLAVVLGQEGSFTEENDNTGGDGSQIMLGFSATDAVSPTYATQPDASDASGSNGTDKIRPLERVYLVPNDVPGLNETAASLLDWLYVSGDQTDNDVSSLYFPENSGFNPDKPMSVFVACSSRVSTDIDMKETDGLFEGIVGINKSLNFADDGLMRVEFSVEKDRVPTKNNTSVTLSAGGSSGNVSPLSVTKKTGTANIYYVDIKVNAIVRSPYTSVSNVSIKNSNGSITFSSANNIYFREPVGIESVISINQSSNYINDRMIRVHFSVENRDPAGNTSIEMSDESYVLKNMTVLSVTKNTDTTNTYFAIVRNDNGLVFTPYNRATQVRIMNVNRTVEFSSVTSLFFGPTSSLT